MCLSLLAYEFISGQFREKFIYIFEKDNVLLIFLI
jgi:hypothetical protein